MLESLSSTEIVEWRAYETLNGPVGSGAYEQEALASIQEMLQHVARILIAANADEDSKIPEMVHYPRPFEFMQPPSEEESQEE